MKNLVQRIVLMGMFALSGCNFNSNEYDKVDCLNLQRRVEAVRMEMEQSAPEQNCFTKVGGLIEPTACEGPETDAYKQKTAAYREFFFTYRSLCGYTA